MYNRLFANFMLALASILITGCTTDNVMQDASQVSNLNEVDFSVFEKSIEDLPTRAGDASGTPLSETELFSELEVAMIPTTKVDEVSYSVRQLSKDDDTFGMTKLYVPDGEYYLVAIAANTKNPSKGHQVTIKSTTEIDFPDSVISDMAYYCDKVKISGDKKTTLSVPLKRGAACFHLCGVRPKLDNAASYKITLSSVFGSVFDPSTGCCAKENTVVRTYNLTSYQGKTLDFTVYCLLSKTEVTNAVITGTAFDKDGKVIKAITLNGVHMVQGKRTTYTGPLFTSTTEAGFTIIQTDMENVDSGHTFE